MRPDSACHSTLENSGRHWESVSSQLRNAKVVPFSTGETGVIRYREAHAAKFQGILSWELFATVATAGKRGGRASIYIKKR